MKVDVKVERVKKGLTQEELAEKVGVRRQTISMIELGTNNPSPKLAIKIGKALKIKKKTMVEWLLSLG